VRNLCIDKIFEKKDSIVIVASPGLPIRLISPKFVIFTVVFWCGIEISKEEGMTGSLNLSSLLLNER
jgi:hypothetical protein